MICVIRENGKEVVLHPLQEVEVSLIGEVGGQQTQLGTQFVYGAIGFEPFVGFRYAGASYQAGSAAVAGACVEFHKDDVFMGVEDGYIQNLTL